MSKRGGNPYQRTHRSDALSKLETQVEEIKQVGARDEELRKEIRELRAFVRSESERIRMALEEIKHWMTRPLPAQSEDTRLMVECLDRVQEIVRLEHETRDATEALLVKLVKRPRVAL